MNKDMNTNITPIKMKFLYVGVIISLLLNVISLALFLNISNALGRTAVAIETYRGEELQMMNSTQEDIVFINDVLIKILKN